MALPHKEATLRNDPNRIDEEEVTFDSLVNRIEQIDSATHVTWDRVPPGQDPPDYWLSVGDQRFAVEITCIVTGQDYRALLSRLHQNIRDGCRAKGIRGSYFMSLLGSPDISSHRGRRQWETFVSQSVSRIENMDGGPVGQKISLLRDSKGYLTITKASEAGGAFQFASTSFNYAVDLQAEIAELVEEAIRAKHEKIRRKGVLGVCPNVILALYDVHNNDTIQVAQQAFAKVQNFEWLHSIYWAASFTDRPNKLFPNSPGRGGVFLYSKIENWR